MENLFRKQSGENVIVANRRLRSTRFLAAVQSSCGQLLDDLDNPEIQMARNESDREDLLADAVALVRRVELEIADEAEPVVAGVRGNGWLSIYFGSEPVYHFDETGRLRRAFDGDCLYRTQGTTLARLNRTRNETTTILNRYDLDESEVSEFLNTMAARLRRLQKSLQDGQSQILRSVPAETDFRPELLERLETMLQSPPTLAPAFPGKR